MEITPNRGDCLSMRGLARDLSAATGESGSGGGSGSGGKRAIVTRKETIPISVLTPSDCPRYVGRIITDINNKLETPSWMQHILQRAGARLINLVVDVCNYVMLELGQPMHAFDLSALKNKIIVRRAKQNEKIKLLDENIITLTADDVVIADDHSVHALAGIMGGLDSAVSANTNNIFLEAAFFEPKTICLSKRRHNTSSDSSYRFERGVDFNLPIEAIERATELLLQITGGKPSDVIEVVSKEQLPKRDKIILEQNQIQRILGIEISNEKVERILKSLGMLIKRTDHSSSHSHPHWEIIPPSFRFDITQPIDFGRPRLKKLK